jgi:tripartite-type tricarboxylate transporter receptor subunit TctC
MRHGYATVALAVAWIFAACAAAPASAFAQTYPDRSVRIIIAFAAGGTIDTLGRIVAQKLSEAWGQSVFVENRPGASGNIGAWRRHSRRRTAIRFTSVGRCWR